MKNLPRILTEGGLYSDKAVRARSLGSVSIAHASIRARRAATPVPVPPYGMVGDYVPFYFAPSSPMLYTISQGNVEGYAEGQEPILHLEVWAEDIKDAGYPFVFTDGHAIMQYTSFYTELQDLSNIDWPLLQAEYWNDTLAEPDRKRRRQAEFLVRDFVPWDLVRRIGTMSESVAAIVTTILSGTAQPPEVIVRRRWYY